MDGLELAKRIKADPKISRTRLIMLSSMGSLKAATREERGIEAVLTKPVRQSSLYDALAHSMSQGTDPLGPPEVNGQSNAKKTSGNERMQCGARVLVAEDNPVNQQVARKMLTKLGCVVDIAEDGVEALSKLGEREYDIVFMDCHMPHLDGYSAARLIREREGDAQHTVIVAMTANALQGDRERCIVSGMDDYIAKPVRLEDLIAVMKKWIKGPKGPSSENEAGAGTRNGSDRQSLDRERIRELKELAEDGDTTWLQSLAEGFLNDAAMRLRELSDALEQNDVKRLKTAAHTLKGSSHNIGAFVMARMCKDLEADVDAGALESVKARIKELGRELGCVRVEIEHFVFNVQGQQ
jgi:CheY-like chemotaxis protein